MFLAECQYETRNGECFTEQGSGDYFEDNGYGEKYRGAGGIHLTHKYAYQAFSIYIFLEDYPELRNYVTYRNPAHNNAESIAEAYDDWLEYAKEKGIDIKNYEKIVEKGADCVADEYPWESAGYYWYVNRMNGYADDPNEGIDTISAVINYYGNSMRARKEHYERYCREGLFVIE